MSAIDRHAKIGFDGRGPLMSELFNILNGEGCAKLRHGWLGVEPMSGGHLAAEKSRDPFTVCRQIAFCDVRQLRERRSPIVEIDRRSGTLRFKPQDFLRTEQ